MAAPHIAARARNLVRGCDRAVLATVASDAGRGLAGHPAAALTLAACGHDGAPLLLISDLARHARDLRADARATLHFEARDGPPGEPLDGARVVVFGRAALVEDEPARGHAAARFVRRHPETKRYMQLDFRLWRVAPDMIHVNAGYGQARWIGAADFLNAPAPGLAGAEADAIEHMNADHAEAVDAMVAAFAAAGAGARPDRGWRLVGLDPDGLDARHPDGGHARIAFAAPLSGAEAVRPTLVALSAAAREALAERGD